MRITIETPEADGVSIIPNANLGAITLLEGNNGIGKSTLVRVLQVCVGQLPYPGNPRAWGSLREALGKTIVRISGLTTAASIEWRFDTHAWTDYDGAPADSWFDSITIDGVRSSLGDIRKHLSVHRLSGESDIAGSFAEVVETYGVALTSALAQLGEHGPSPWAATSALLADTAELCHVADGHAIATESNTLKRAINQRDEMQARAVRAAESASSLFDLVIAERELTELRAAEPGVRARLHEISELLTTKEADRATVVKALQSLASAAAIGEKDRSEVESAERNYNRNFGLLRDAELRLSELKAQIGTDPGTEPGPEVLETTVSRLKDLTRRRDAIDRTPAMRKLVGFLGERLERASSDGLDDERPLPLGYEPLTTVSALRAAIEDRVEELRAEPASNTAEIDLQISETSKLLESLKRIPKLQDDIRRLRGLVDKHQSALKLLADSKNLAATQEYEDLSLSLATVDNEMLALQTEQARLTQLLSQLSVNGDLGVIAARARRLRQSAGLTETEDAEAARERAATDLNRVEKELLQLEADVVEARKLSDSRSVAIEHAAGLLSEDPAFEWVRQAVGDLIPGDADSPGLVAIKLDTIFRRLKGAASSAQQFRRDLLAASAALDAIAKTLRGTVATTDLYFGQLRSWFEDRFSEYFNHPAVREAMFPPNASKIRVDLSDMQVQWNEDGATKQRAFETFSSGQQAFAYARAQLGVIDSENYQATTRLICLDEFGAFLSADRRSELVAYLRDRTTRFPDDRVLLTLPVRFDYAEAASSALGQERDRLSEIARELDQVGYFQEAL